MQSNLFKQGKSIFELNLMSKADKIYTTGGSMYSNLAEMISGKNIICSFYDMYSPDEIYDVLLKFILFGIR